MLNKILPDYEEQKVFQKLEAFLKPRIEAVKNGDFSLQSVDAVFDQVELEAISNIIQIHGLKLKKV